MQNRKKILFLITKGNFGGAQRYVFDLATSLDKEKFDVVVGCGEGKGLQEKLQQENIRIIELKHMKRDIGFFSEWKALKELFGIIKIENPDVIHLNSSKMGILGSLAGRLVGIRKIIFTGHGWAFNEDRNVLAKIIFALSHWFTILICHKTIAVSKNTENQIKNFPFVKNKVVQIYNGIEPFPSETKDKSRSNIILNKKEVLWIGTISELHRNKGLDFAIKAFNSISKRNPNVLMVIIGEGEERPVLEKMVAELNLKERVIFTGFIKNAKRMLSAFDVFFLTSRTEAFPYALLEAGILGIPILATKVGGIPEIIENEKTGLLIPPKDSQKIEDSFKKLIENETLRKNLGKNLQDKVLKEFSKSKMFSETLSVYLNH